MKTPKQRTAQEKESDAQRRALHKLFTDISNTLNEHGVTLKDLLLAFGEDDVAPTGDNIKAIWKSQLKRMYYKDSTNDQITSEINTIFMEFNKKVSILTGENIEFPSEEARQLIIFLSENL